MPLRVCPLGSGSKGNAVFVTDGTVSFLIDCGLSAEETRRRLELRGMSVSDLRFILLTHEHTDHIRSAEIFAELYNVPVYCHEKTLRALRAGPFKRLKNAATFSTFSGFSAEAFSIVPFKNPHDVFTVGYSVAGGGSRFVYATDMGYAAMPFMDAAAGAELVMIESNYDKEMLKNGRYPPYLKRRITSENGHLSNPDCADAILKLYNKGTRNFILGHLSEENNLPDLARRETETLLYQHGGRTGQDFSLHIALQHEPSEWIGTDNERM